MADLFPNAVAYEKMMGRWSMRLAPLFLDFAGVRDGRTLLDVGCGTGSLVEAMANRSPGSAITGIDPSRPSVDYARQRFPDPRFSFDCGDAMALPYPNASFDHSLSLLVFQFIPQPEKAACEMRRVTRPGGTVAACTWDSAEGGHEMNGIFWEEVAKLDPAAAASRERNGRCDRAGELTKVWRAAGFENVEEVALQIRTDFSNFDDYWLPYTNGVGPTGAYSEKLSSTQREALRVGLRRRLLGNRADGPFSLRSRACAVRSTVPKQ